MTPANQGTRLPAADASATAHTTSAAQQPRLTPAPRVHGAADAIHVRIGTLALPDLTRAEGVRFGAAFERELVRLLAAGDMPSQLRKLEQLLVPRFVIGPNETVEVTGRRLARVIASHLQP